jgi:hypothetical protein
MPGLGPGIHVFLSLAAKSWMAGASPAMTQTEPSHYEFMGSPAHHKGHDRTA